MSKFCVFVAIVATIPLINAAFQGKNGENCFLFSKSNPVPGSICLDKKVECIYGIADPGQCEDGLHCCTYDGNVGNKGYECFTKYGENLKEAASNTICQAAACGTKLKPKKRNIDAHCKNGLNCCLVQIDILGNENRACFRTFEEDSDEEEKTKIRTPVSFCQAKTCGPNSVSNVKRNCKKGLHCCMAQDGSLGTENHWCHVLETRGGMILKVKSFESQVCRKECLPTEGAYRKNETTPDTPKCNSGLQCCSKK